jgi:DNA topoisomerase I
VPPRPHSQPDPEESAEIAGLRYATDATPGITRIHQGQSFIYRDASGNLIRDNKVLTRIRALIVPPAWKNVWISPDPYGHLQAVGYDARGRKQYRYHSAFRTVRSQTGFDRMPEMGAALSSARKRVRKDLSLAGMTRDKVLATVVRLLDTTAIRIGNEGSATENHTFGLTTLRNKHVAIKGSTLRFRFVGKSGVKQELKVTDKRVARVIRKCHDLPGQRLFEYLDENGDLRGIASTDVNQYLREISGQHLTAKDFRTWHGTLECAVALRALGEFSSEAESKRNILAAIRTAAERLGNRVATCRAYYIHPAVTDFYQRGELVSMMNRALHARPASLLSADERAVLTLVRRHRYEALAKKSARKRKAA